MVFIPATTMTRTPTSSSSTDGSSAALAMSPLSNINSNNNNNNSMLSHRPTSSTGRLAKLSIISNAQDDFANLDELELLEQRAHIDQIASVMAGTAGGRSRKIAIQNSNATFKRGRSDQVLLDTLSPVDKDEEELAPTKRWLKIVLPHVGLVLMCIIYTLAGAGVFYWFERPFELRQRLSGQEEIRKSREQLLEQLWELSSAGVNDEQRGGWVKDVEQGLDNMTGVLFTWFNRNYIMSHEQMFSNRTEDHLMWTYATSIFFSASMITTIGYGNLVPMTTEGRMFCVIYGLLGIPMILMTIADMGKFIADAICLLYARYQRIRRSISKFRRQSMKRGTTHQDTNSELELELEQFNMDRGTVPLVWILVIIVGYTALGGLLLKSYEDWTFGQAFYFSFITMSTVGFGDFVPSNKTYYAVTLLYILLGLTITTMCVEQVGSQYIQKIHYFGRKIHSARAALRTVGDLMRYTAFLRKRYNLTEAQLRNITLKETLDHFFEAHAFTPHDINRIYFIDQRTDTSMMSVGRSSIAHLRSVADENQTDSPQLDENGPLAFM